MTITVPITLPSGGSPAGSPPWDLAFTLVRRRNCATKLYETTEGITIDEAAETASVSLPSSATDVEPGRCWFDFWRTDEGDEEILAIGYLTVKGDARFPTA